MVVCNGLHEHNVRTGILCDLFDLKFPEMGCLNLDLSAGYGNNTILGGLDTLANFLALTHIELHGLYLLAIIGPAVPISDLGVFMALIYQLVYVNLYLLMSIISFADTI
jgi:hypothetical protein